MDRKRRTLFNRLFYLLISASAATAVWAQPKETGSARLMVQAGHSSQAAPLAVLSPDGRWVATYSGSVIKIWSAEYGRLLCDLASPRVVVRPASNAGRDSPSRTEDADAHDEDRASLQTLVWMADSRSLVALVGPNELARFDAYACRLTESLEVKDLERPRHDPEESRGAMIHVKLRQLSLLSDGRVLALANTGLYELQLLPGSVQTKTMAMFQSEKPNDRAQRMGNPLELLRKGGVAGMVEAMTEEMSASAPLVLAGHSRDGRLALLTRTAPVGLLTAARSPEPLIVSGGKVTALSAWMNLAPGTFKGASLAQLSISGKYAALRLPAAGGARLVWLDLTQRRMRELLIQPATGLAADAGPLQGNMSGGLSMFSAFTGLAISPDERYVAIYRPRVKASISQPGDPTLDIRQVIDLQPVRTIPLHGGVVAHSDVMANLGFTLLANSLASSGDHRAFVLQTSSLGSGNSLATAEWQNNTVKLNSWSATELPVRGLAFAAEDRLTVLRDVVTSPGRDAIRQGRQVASAPGGSERAAADSTFSGNRLQVANWNLASGGARIHRLETIAGPNQAVDPSPLSGSSDRLLTLDTLIVDERKGPLTQLVASRISSDATLWRVTLSVPGYEPLSARAPMFSPDGQVAAVIVEHHPRQDPRVPPAFGVDPAAQPTGSRPQAPPVAAPTADAPTESDRRANPLRGLGGLLGGILKGQLPALPAEGQGTNPQAGPSVNGGRDARSASNEFVVSAAGPQRSRAWVLLFDASSGKPAGQIELRGAPSSDSSVAFLGGNRLVIGAQWIDLRAQTGSPSMSWERARSGVLPQEARLLAVSPTTGRPLFAGVRMDRSWRAVDVPAKAARAELAAISADDRWLVVADSGYVRVMDLVPSATEVFSFDLGNSVATQLAVSGTGRYIAVGTSLGTTRLFDVQRRQELPTLLTTSQGAWVVVDGAGRLDSNNLAQNQSLHWVVPDSPMRPVPFDALVRGAYVPDLLTRAINGEPVTTARSNPGGLPTPSVAIDAVEPAQPGSVRVKLTVSSPPGSPAHNLRLLRNGRLVGFAPAVDGALLADPRTGRVQQVFQVRLPAGDQALQFEAFAFNSAGQKGATASRSYKPERPVPLARKAYVLTIGVNHHSQPDAGFRDLDFAVSDAELMQSALVNALTASGDYSSVVGVSLVSSGPERQQATKARIQAALAALGGRPDTARVLAGIPSADQLGGATPEDLVIIGFAGHGYRGTAGELYLVPSDVSTKAAGGGPSNASAISSAELETWLRPVDAGLMTMIIDACHSGSAVAADFNASPLGASGLGQLAYDKGMRLLAATQADDQALEHGKLQHGFLTYALVKEGLLAKRADALPNESSLKNP